MYQIVKNYTLGFGFVAMSSDAEAQAAITALNGKKCGDYTVKVEESQR